MNALDSLFDFAALMSTSSAMTAAPNIHKSVQNQPGDNQELVSKPLSPHKTQAPCSCESQSQKLEQPPQMSYESPSTCTQDKTIACFSRAHLNSNVEYPIDWIPALPQPQDVCVRQPGIHQRGKYEFLQTSGLDHESFCGHPPSLRCNCRVLPPITDCHTFDFTPPWMQQQNLFQQPDRESQQSQTLHQQGFPFELCFENRFYGQAHQNQYISSPSLYDNKGHIPVTWEHNENHAYPIAWPYSSTRDQQHSTSESGPQYWTID